MYKIEKILESGELVSFSQTIQDIKQQSVFGYEMLIRGPVDSDLHRADQLFQAAGQHQLNDLLEIKSLQTHLLTIAQSDPAYCYSVNIAPHLLFNNQVEALLADNQSASRTKLELTEHLPVKDWGPVKNRMQALRKLGYEFWLDDVGCGFFDLELIDEVKPEVVKLCIKIVSQLSLNTKIKSDIRVVVDAVHQYGGKVLAEGIEEQSQLLIAQELEIDYAQGYYFDKPKAVNRLR